MKIKITLHLQADLQEDQEIGGFVSHCLAFDIYSQGRTMEEAKEALKSAVRMTLEYAFRRGRLEEMLRKALRDHEDAIFMEAEQIRPTETIMDVPLSLVAQEKSSYAGFSARPI